MSKHPPPLDFGILLNVAFGAFKQGLHEHLESAGFDDLGGTFGYIARTLDASPDGLSLKDLAAALAVTPQGALKIVDDMVGKGYVARTPDPVDTRVKRLRITGRGRALLQEAGRFHRRFERELAQQFGAQAVQETRRVLESLVQTRGLGRTIRMQLL